MSEVGSGLGDVGASRWIHSEEESNPVAKHSDLEASLPHSLPQFAPASPLAPPRRSQRGPGRQLQPEAFDVDD